MKIIKYSIHQTSRYSSISLLNKITINVNSNETTRREIALKIYYNQYMRFIRNNSFLMVVIFLACILRLWSLGSVPYGFANDEVSYIISGYTIANSGGFDIANRLLPLSVNLDSSLSPVPVYIISLFSLFGFSPFISRLPFALLGIGTVALVYLITLSIFKNKTIALLSSLSLAISPWHLFVTRGVYGM